MRTCSTCQQARLVTEFHHKRDVRRPHLAPRPIGRCKPCERERLRRAMQERRAEASSTYEDQVVRVGRTEADRRRVLRAVRESRRVRRARARAMREPVPMDAERTCNRCSRPFRPKVTRQRYCSDECNWREQRSRRRARDRAAYVEHVDMADIYARDAGVCQLCFKRVDRRCSYPHPRTPVLDHIVPLSRGGKHERRNVQLAHHGCNSRKNARSVGSQLRLLG